MSAHDAGNPTISAATFSCLPSGFPTDVLLEGGRPAIGCGTKAESEILDSVTRLNVTINGQVQRRAPPQPAWRGPLLLAQQYGRHVVLYRLRHLSPYEPQWHRSEDPRHPIENLVLALREGGR